MEGVEIHGLTHCFALLSVLYSQGVKVQIGSEPSWFLVVLKLFCWQVSCFF